ncbi:MAG: hypothetical protein IT442_03965 [Phycisphaeraceae bacterium]|nr:hypothetical protein [Phycisphaeraceae bacterium]
MITSIRRDSGVHAAPECFRERMRRPTPISTRVRTASRADRAVRVGLIRRIRGQIHAGTYDESVRVEALLDALAKDLGLAPVGAIHRAEREARALASSGAVYADGTALRAANRSTATEAR